MKIRSAPDEEKKTERLFSLGGGGGGGIEAALPRDSLKR